jgi:hypothetical protein
MNPHELNRRDFHRLSMAAFSGALAGTMAGCGDEKKPAPAGGGAEVASTGTEHGCRGLNACKNQGASGKNDCAGQGTCATKSWHHSCSAQNACKGQGGCGDKPLQNDCKGQGSCSIPLMDSAWEKARKHFDEQMKKEGKEVGEAPPAKS